MCFGVATMVSYIKSYILLSDEVKNTEFELEPAKCLKAQVTFWLRHLGEFNFGFY